MTVDPLTFERMVIEHVEAENARDPARVRRTYSDTPVFVDKAEGCEFKGWDEILASYEERWRGFPDSIRTIKRIQTTEKGAYTEITIRGTHTGVYKGFPPTGAQHSIDICAHFEPAPDGRIATETVYYDRITPMVAFGILPDVDKTAGKMWLALHRPSVVLKRLRARFASN